MLSHSNAAADAGADGAGQQKGDRGANRARASRASKKAAAAQEKHVPEEDAEENGNDYHHPAQREGGQGRPAEAAGVCDEGGDEEEEDDGEEHEDEGDDEEQVEEQKQQQPKQRKKSAAAAAPKNKLTERQQMLADIEEHSKKICYSDWYHDDVWEYRHVTLPKALVKYIPHPTTLMADWEWRALGIRQSAGWEHYLIHAPEPHVLLFRREKDYQVKYPQKKPPA